MTLTDGWRRGYAFWRRLPAENVGWALGNEQMQAEGLKTKKEGEAEIKAAQTQQYAKGMGEDIKGNVKEGWGKMTGDESLKAEGKAQQTQGQVRKDFNS